MKKRKKNARRVSTMLVRFSNSRVLSVSASDMVHSHFRVLDSARRPRSCSLSNLGLLLGISAVARPVVRSKHLSTLISLLERVSIPFAIARS